MSSPPDPILPPTGHKSDGADDRPVGMEIPVGRGKRVLNGFLFAALVIGVAAVLVVLFVRFTASLRIAMALVAFMLAYMVVMSYVVLRRDDQGR